MKTIKFDLQPPMETPFGGACSDFFQMPSCGFICGKLEFSCKHFQCRRCVTKINTNGFNVGFARYQPGAISLEFHFHSDESVGADGFLISFEQVYDC